MWDMSMARFANLLRTFFYYRLLLLVHVIIGGVVYISGLCFLRTVNNHGIKFDKYLGSRPGLITKLLNDFLIH